MDNEPFVLAEWKQSPFEFWSKKFVANNIWRVRAGLGEFNDGVGECALVFAYCKYHYCDHPTKIKANSPAHFMAIFKKAVYCWFNDWASYDRKQRGAYLEDMETEPDVRLDTPFPVCVSVGRDVESVLHTRIKGATKELRQVVYIMEKAPLEIMEVLGEDVKEPLEFFRKIAGKVLGINTQRLTEMENEFHDLLDKNTTEPTKKITRSLLLPKPGASNRFYAEKLRQVLREKLGYEPAESYPLDYQEV